MANKKNISNEILDLSLRSVLIVRPGPPVILNRLCFGTDSLLYSGPLGSDVFSVRQSTQYNRHGLLHGELYIRHANNPLTL